MRLRRKEVMLFPARIKVEISSKLSYPAGAELISAEWSAVPQANSFEISFHLKHERMMDRGKPYKIFIVGYAGTRSSYLDSGWTIGVYPVPRALKHAMNEAPIGEFFPRIRQWLEKYSGTSSRLGGHWLSVVLSESDEALLTLEEYHTISEAISN